MEKGYQQLLDEKNKDELKVICRKLNLDGYSKLSIGRLKTLILDNENNSNFKNAIGIKPPFFLRRDVLLTFIGIIASFLIGFYFFVIDQGDSKESTESITNTINKTIERKFKPVEELADSIKEIYKTDLEYSKYIEEQEDLNNLLLENIFGKDFQVFGQRNNHLFKNSIQFNSQIFSNKKEYVVLIDFTEIEVGTSNGTTFKNMPSFIPFEMIKKGKVFPTIFKIGGKTLCILLLNDDKTNPVWAIGFR